MESAKALVSFFFGLIFSTAYLWLAFYVWSFIPAGVWWYFPAAATTFVLGIFVWFAGALVGFLICNQLD